VGSDGKIFVDRGIKLSDPKGIIDQPLGEKDVHLYKSPGHQRDWLNCVRARTRPLCDVEIGARSVTVCHLGTLAYWNQRKLAVNPGKVAWDGKERRFKDDEANKWLDRERREPWHLPQV